MDVLLFTHRSDIDGMGNAVLARLAFDNVNYVLCETFDLQNEVLKFYEDGSIYNYDMIFVTDLWLEEPTLTRVAKDKRLQGKFFVFDHHKSSLARDLAKHYFTTVRISDEKGLCSGTSLFYEYLTKQGFLPKEQTSIEEFCELTRKYDTWEWKTKYNDETPHELTLLFDSVGCDGYIELMVKKLQEKKPKFTFNELEKMLIANKRQQVLEKLKNYASKVIYQEVMGLNAGIVFIDYEYRNDLAEYFRTQNSNIDIDFVMLIALDSGTISYRSIKAGVNVRLIAEAMGGKGHDKAASSPIGDQQRKSLLKVLIKENN